MKMIIFVLLLLPVFCSAQKQKTDTISKFTSLENNWQLQISSPTIYAEFLKDVVRFYDGENLIAYKKKDSSWVLINPNKLKIVLDSIISINKHFTISQ